MGLGPTADQTSHPDSGEKHQVTADDRQVDLLVRSMAEIPRPLERYIGLREGATYLRCELRRDSAAQTPRENLSTLLELALRH